MAGCVGSGEAELRTNTCAGCLCSTGRALRAGSRLKHLTLPTGTGRVGGSSSTGFRDGDSGPVRVVCPQPSRLSVAAGLGLGLRPGEPGRGEGRDSDLPFLLRVRREDPCKVYEEVCRKGVSAAEVPAGPSQCCRDAHSEPPQCLGAGADPQAGTAARSWGKGAGQSSWPRQGRGHRPQDSRPLGTDGALFRQKRRRWRTLQVPQEER